MTRTFLMGFAVFLSLVDLSAATTITFEGLATSNVYGGPGGGAYWNGNDFSGSFQSGGATFNNYYDGTFGPYWEGFAYSNTKDTVTAVYTNQVSAYAGSGHNASSTYGLGFTGGFVITPTILLPEGQQIQGMYVTNTTYAALSMLNGDLFAKKFGGQTGDDPDWFKLTVTGRTDSNSIVGSKELYLADFQFSNSAQDYILNTWAYLDLHTLSAPAKLEFSLASSDTGVFGINTPAYFAIDDLTFFQAVPEPGTFLLSGLAVLFVFAFRVPRPNR